MSEKTYNRYSDKFKEEAIRQLEANLRKPASHIAAELSVSRSLIYRWRKKLLKARLVR